MFDIFYTTLLNKIKSSQTRVPNIIFHIYIFLRNKNFRWKLLKDELFPYGWQIILNIDSPLKIPSFLI